jgi:hypothetical protein
MLPARGGAGVGQGGVAQEPDDIQPRPDTGTTGE